MRLSAILLQALATVGVFVDKTAAQCSGQGEGNCQLSFVGIPRTDCITYDNMLTCGEAITWTDAYIFDYACNQIGNAPYPAQGLAIYSELPWTVVITFLTQGGPNNAFLDFRSIGFAYAAYSYHN
ncbi:uncharacterized protein LY89DRAFT_730770 [Mollisia scopiformis]|uniref:Uncharacterized protein n=1 Tax=Mollisia scopiformis TaxID=149040 RepID=A0A194XKV0_MOLSC|nr:uncharacterized protein LY89DRAFT_730770 [Mollisia scopiformis]KUJ20756.1 hypothetical protein LY89DRAFT_730770 [Mollisia scopiformis]